jgi:RimJ/RimL family protein N-acetyltransferase
MMSSLSSSVLRYNPGDAQDKMMLPIGKSVAPVEAPEQPERRVYEGHFVHLYPLNPGTDGSDLYGVSHGDEEIERLWTYLPYGPFASQEEMTAWVSQIETGLDPLFFTVRHAETQNALGMVSFLSLSAPNLCLELGHIWYAPDAQRTRANTEAAYLMLEEAFGRLRCRRVEWKCDSLNEKSRTAALRLGFTFEVIFRQH